MRQAATPDAKPDEKAAIMCQYFQTRKAAAITTAMNTVLFTIAAYLVKP
jgi:hypothetical protein